MEDKIQIIANKIIIGKIIEIFIVIILLILSIPVWQNFENKMSEANIITQIEKPKGEMKASIVENYEELAKN